MKANHSKTKTVVRVIAFLLIVVLVYGALTEVLSVNNTWDMRHIRGFYREPKNLFFFFVMFFTYLNNFCYFILIFLYFVFVPSRGILFPNNI